MHEISYGNILLKQSGKRGILLPDEQGLYELNAGAFSSPNHAGIRYPVNDYVKRQMEENSDVRRRISQGYCYMEEEHPEPFNYIYHNGQYYKEEITSLAEWIARLRNYDKDRIVAVISEIIFRPDDPMDLNKPVWLFLKCKPLMAYPSGPRFKENLDTPEANTAVSIRTQIERYRQNLIKNIVYWAGFDWVKEPGMVHANKHMSAGCESFLSGTEYTPELHIKTWRVADAIEELEHHLKCVTEDFHDGNENLKLAMQRMGGMEKLAMFEDELSRLKASYRPGDKVTVASGVRFTDLFR